MVYLEPVHLGWKPLIQTWVERFQAKFPKYAADMGKWALSVCEEASSTSYRAFEGVDMVLVFIIIIERANAQNAADPVYLDGMVWSASYALARPRALDTGLENRLEQAPQRSPGANPSKRRNAAARRAETPPKTDQKRCV